MQTKYFLLVYIIIVQARLRAAAGLFVCLFGCLFVGLLAYQGKDIVFRFIIEYYIVASGILAPR
jgi:hypothetical protein